MEKKQIRKLIILTSVGTLFGSAILFLGGYFVYTKYLSGFLYSYNLSQQSKSIVKTVGNVVFLPEGEDPQVATVLQADELKKDNLFFAKAKNGDAMLLYKNAGIIILFDMQRKKLLNMGSIATSSQSATETTSSKNFNFNN